MSGADLCLPLDGLLTQTGAKWDGGPAIFGEQMPDSGDPQA